MNRDIVIRIFMVFGVVLILILASTFYSMKKTDRKERQVVQTTGHAHLEALKKLKAKYPPRDRDDAAKMTPYSPSAHPSK